MDQIFLSENERFKIAFLQTIINSPEKMTINSLKEIVGFSYSKTRYLVLELNEDLLELGQKQLVNATGKLNKDYSHHLISHYRMHLIKSSIAYRFLLNFLVDEEYTFQQLCCDSYISRSSVFRKLAPLKRYLEGYDLRLKIAKMTILGDEYVLRTALFNFLWLIDGGDELSEIICLSPQSYQLTTAWAKNISLQEVRLFLSIAVCRYKKGCYIKTRSFAEYRRPEMELGIKRFMREAVPPAYLDQELNFFSYFFTYNTFYFDGEDPRIVFLTESYRETVTDRLTTLFFNLCEDKFHIQTLPAKERKILYINMLNTFNRFLISRKALPTMLDFQFLDRRYQDDIFKNGEDFLQMQLQRIARKPEFAWITACLPQLTTACFCHLALYYDVSPVKKLKVGVKYDPNFVVVGEILHQCKNLAFLETSIEVEVSEEYYDVVIETNPIASILVKLQQNGEANQYFLELSELELLRGILSEYYHGLLGEEYSRELIRGSSVE